MATAPKRHLPRWFRAALLTAHITTAAAWFGITTTLIALTIAGQHTPTTLNAWMTTPAAALTLITGTALGMHRPWGLRRHHWLRVKIRVTAIVVAAGLTSLTGVFDPLTVLTARICALVALVAAVALSVTKPWGLVKEREPSPAGRLQSVALTWRLPGS